MHVTEEGVFISFRENPESQLLSEGDTIADIVYEYAPQSYIGSSLFFCRQRYGELSVLSPKPRDIPDIPIYIEDIPVVFAALATYADEKAFDHRLEECRTYHLGDDEAETVATYLRTEQDFICSLLDQLAPLRSAAAPEA